MYKLQLAGGGAARRSRAKRVEFCTAAHKRSADSRTNSAQPPTNSKPFINASPTRAQLAAVSAIRILLVGVERLILPPQVPQGIASLRTKTVTIFSVCCPHFAQRIRRIVRSEVENFISWTRDKIRLVDLS